MNDSVVSEIRELLTKNQNVGILVGNNPTTDEMGAALALYLSFKTSGQNISIASVGEPIVELSNLVGIDKVKKDFEGEGGDLVVSFPYREGEIDKISYTLEDGSLNIVVKPGEQGLSFSEEDVIFKRKGEYPQLVFIVGCPRLSDLSSVFDVHKSKDTLVVNIDNKIDNQRFGDVVLVSDDASSVSEQVVKLLLSLGFDIDLDVAQNLLSGISFATNNFQDPQTTSVAFEMAGTLMGKGAIRQRMVSKIQPQKEENSFDLSQGKMLQDLAKRQTRPQPVRNVSQLARNDTQDVSGRNDVSRASQGQVNRDQKKNIPLNNPPEDWLTPKVYKGSTNV
jgi:nanoRNase/pAp phosphatase (c-di-AMP/oligoRNAs hydrolase)